MKVEKKVLNEALRRISGSELRGGGSGDRVYDLPVLPAGRFFFFRAVSFEMIRKIFISSVINFDEKSKGGITIFSRSYICALDR